MTIRFVATRLVVSSSVGCHELAPLVPNPGSYRGRLTRFGLAAGVRRGFAAPSACQIILSGFALGAASGLIANGEQSPNQGQRPASHPAKKPNRVERSL
jgi:hypothetical protein